MNKFSLSTRKIYYDWNQVLRFVMFLSGLILLSACEGQAETNLPIQGTDEIQIDTFSSPIPTPHLTPSKLSVMATATVTRVLTLDVSTTIPTETAISLPTPTLTAEEWRQRWQMIDAQIASIMASNNGCQLPCWWGIEPGEPLSEAQEVFNTLDENGWVDSPSQQGELQRIGFFSHSYKNEIGEPIFADFTIDLLTQEKFIKAMGIHVFRGVSSRPDTPRYNQIGERLVRDWDQYSVQKMFETLGTPDLIYLLPRSLAHGDDYEFNIYYPSLGIVASYSPFELGVNDNGEQKMCLSLFDMQSIHLYLYDPIVELPNSYLEATYSLWPLDTELTRENVPLIEFRDLESSTGISIDEFVTRVMESEDDICFAVN